MKTTRLSNCVKFLHISAVESVEALSEMINSKSVKDCFNTESIDWLNDNSPLYTGSPIVTFGI